jgi:hypothetical protein
LVQPSETLRALQEGRLRPDSATLAALKTNLFTHHLPSLTLDCTRDHDQLTAELRDFVRAVGSGDSPRVTGEDGCRAVAAAERVLQAVNTHRWEGTADGTVGPNHLPEAQNLLFLPPADEAAA